MVILLDFAFLMLAAAGGAAVTGLVVWLRSGTDADPLSELEANFAQETLSRLQDLTRKVAAEVDQHAVCVQEINAQLASTDDKDEAAVLSAVSQLIEANRRMQSQLDSAEERLKTQALQIESHAEEARTDALTGVANRRALDDELAQCLADFQEHGTPSTVMLLDVDHFKKFNDTYGHQAGDDALRTVARSIRHSVSDVGFVARYGGEEFAVIFAGLSAEAAIPYAERAREAICQAVVCVGHEELRVTASAGMTETLSGDTEDEVIRRADEALYASKKGGRDCGHHADGEAIHRIELEHTAQESSSPAAAYSGKIGDEWLYSDDLAAQTHFRESMPNVASRPAFFDDLIRRLGQVHGQGTPLTLVLIQVDSLEQLVSDNGHAAGEAVLRIAAQFINAVMRDMDSVSRLSEDTFALLLPGSHLADGAAIGERLRQGVQRFRLPRKAGVSYCTISVGVVEADASDDLRTILQRGRIALASAVQKGQNRVVSREAPSAARSGEELVAT